MRFSLKWLLVGVAFVGVSLVAMLNANYTWHAAIQNASLVVFLVAIAGAAWSSRDYRAMWFGYVLFGLPYFILATGYFGFTPTPQFASTWALKSIHPHIFSPINENVPYPFSTNFRGGDIVSETAPLPDRSISVLVVRPRRDDFIAVGNALLCIPFGLIGAFIARGFYRRAEGDHKSESRAQQVI